jgi:predicted secreted Zn-dependent protease
LNSGFKSDKGEAMMGLTSGGALRITNLLIQPSAEGFEGTFVNATETVKSADVELNQTVTLPNWVERGQASTEEQTAWDNSMTGLKAHEQGHVEINREAAQKLDKSLPGTAGTGGAPTANEAYKKAGAQLTQKLNQKVRSTSAERNARQKQYDDRTDHGRKKPDGQED